MLEVRPPDFQFQTCLAVGATGMLDGALDWIAARSARTVAIARHAKAALARRARPRTEPLDADWRDTRTFIAAIDSRLDGGGVDLALLWIHSTGAASLEALLDRLAPREGLIVHVLSSAAGDPAAYRSAMRGRTGAARVSYVTVKLGRVADGGGWRWLADAEISAGAIQAIETGRDVVVGETP
jgi:hypothetical protein